MAGIDKRGVPLSGLALISWTPNFGAIMRQEVLHGTKEEI